MTTTTDAVHARLESQASNSGVPADAFREVLGHYPTGVAVVTATVDGNPVGMVVGSFTSVSLDPPLVAFLPARSSSSFDRLKQSAVFCVNVLAADQEDICRQFAMKSGDKFAGMDWTRSPNGSPIIPGCVAWIDCDVESITEAGDHYFVLGRTTALEISTPVLPLLFFQGGYGRFAPGTMMLPQGADFIRSVGHAAEMKPLVEELAREIQAEIAIVAPDRDEAVFIGVANGSGRTTSTAVGSRIPITAPFQPLFVGDANVPRERWLAQLRPGTDAYEASIESLERVLHRGWSLGLSVQADDDVINDLIKEYSSKPRTPSTDRALTNAILEAVTTHDVEAVDPEATYRPLFIAVPVFDPLGKVAFALKAGALRQDVTGAELHRWIDVMQTFARALTATVLSQD